MYFSLENICFIVLPLVILGLFIGKMALWKKIQKLKKKFSDLEKKHETIDAQLIEIYVYIGLFKQVVLPSTTPSAVAIEQKKDKPKRGRPRKVPNGN